ncbi:MAG: hypothetical protein AAF657_13780 [Acidobacteriota bacterium]
MHRARPAASPSGFAGRRALGLSGVLLAALLSIAATDRGTVDDLQITLPGSTAGPCPDQAISTRNLQQANLCFRVPQTVPIQVQLEAPRALRSIAVTWRAANGSTRTLRSVLPQSERKAWTGWLKLPRAATDATRTVDDLLGKSDGPTAHGHYLLDIAAGRYIAVVGLTIAESTEAPGEAPVE